MPAVVIRNIPEATHKALKARAKRNGRSAEAEARRILEAELLGSRSGTAAAVFDDIRQALGGGIDLEFERSKDQVEPPAFK